MDYEKEYKKRLDDARYWHDVSEGDVPTVLEEIFPELREDEDEKIRKEIKQLIQGMHDADPRKERWLTWLEKQGDINRRIQEEVEKQTRQQWKPEIQGDNVSGECNDTALEEQLKIWFEKGKCSGIDDVIFHPQKYGLEKQGENDKEILILKDKIESLHAAIKAIKETSKIEVEKQGEQKPVVIIPKFRVGDEVKTKNEGHLTITRIDEEGYWSNDLFICGFDDSDEWELVEQKPGDKVEPKLTEFEDAVKGMMDVYREAIGVNDATTEEVKKHAAYLLSLIPHKSAEWSEEDEKMLEGIINTVKDVRCQSLLSEIGIYDEYIDWLKSLKPQPKQQWGEEDERERKRIIGLLEGWLSTFKETCYAEDCKCGIDWLKSLRPQKHWKPSNENMYYLNWIANIALGDSVVEREVSKHLNELYNDLKKL